MATTPKEFAAPQLIPVAETTLYTVPTGTTSIVKHATVHNESSGVAEVTIKLNDTEMFKQKLAADEERPLLFMLNATLGAAKTIKASCDTASAVNIMIGGNEVV